MKMPVKNLLVYADGSTREIKDHLVGKYFIVGEFINGDLWERKFAVNLAANRKLGLDEGPHTMVGIEESFELKTTAETFAKWAAERQEEILAAIRHYHECPGGKR